MAQFLVRKNMMGKEKEKSRKVEKKRERMKMQREGGLGGVCGMSVVTDDYNAVVGRPMWNKWTPASWEHRIGFPGLTSAGA
jgi:hypothetical protein